MGPTTAPADGMASADDVRNAHKPRVVFVNRFFYPDHSATSQMLSDLAFALADRGWRIEVVTSRQLYDRPDNVLADIETVRGVRVTRVATTRYGRRATVGRAADYLTFYVSAAAALAKLLRRGDILVAKTDPPILSVIAAPVARMRGAVLVNWLQDVFPEVLEAVSPKSGVTRAGLNGLKWLRDRSLARAKFNIAIGQRMAELIASRGVPQKTIRQISNWADGELVRPVRPEDNELRKAWGLSDKFVVGYSGNLGRAHEIETILSAITALETSRAGSGDNNIAWLFIGGGAQFEALRQEVERRNLTSVQLRPYQPRDMLAQSLSCADVHLVSLRAELEGLIVPSKFYGVAAAGRSCIFIGDADGEIARLIGASGCGRTVREGDGAALAHAIEALRTDGGAAAKSMGTAARAYFDENMTLERAVTEWEAVLLAASSRDALQR